MNQFQPLLSQAMKADSGEASQHSRKNSLDHATVKAAEAISQELFQHRFTDDERKWVGPAVHHTFGTVNGAFYGALARCSTAAHAVYGTGLGAVLWLLADEVAAPTLGLGGPPQGSPVSSHLMAFSSHLVYGVVTEAVRSAASNF